MQQWTAAMRAGDFDAAWAMTAQDLHARDPATRDDPALPYHLRWVWDGTPPDRRHVLVRCYHGLGDTIQFARYLPALAARAASLTVEIQPELLELIAPLAPAARFAPFDVARPLPPAECDIEIMELAFALRMPPDDVAVPYLKATGGLLPAGTVGLCHQAGAWDAARCVPAALLAPLCAGRPCVALVPGTSALPVLNPAGCTGDIVATARLIASAALVITVDTMVAHLAGALGRPLWLLLKAEPDWRWSPGRNSRWYPQARFYVQAATGDWTDVIAAVARDLAAA